MLLYETETSPLWLFIKNLKKGEESDGKLPY